MLIILAGLPGVGKTTIARGLARALEAVHVRIDSIELAIRESGVTVVSIDDAGYRAGYAVAADNLRVGRIVVADSVNPWPLTRDAWREVAGRACTGLLELEIVCSDREEHRRRVEARLGKPPAESGPTWDEVVARDYRPWEREHVQIDTAGATIEQSVASARRAVEDYNATARTRPVDQHASDVQADRGSRSHGGSPAARGSTHT